MRQRLKILVLAVVLLDLVVSTLANNPLDDVVKAEESDFSSAKARHNRHGKGRGRGNGGKGNGKGNGKNKQKNNENEGKTILTHYRIENLWNDFSKLHKNHENDEYSIVCNKLINVDDWTSIDKSDLETLSGLLGKDKDSDELKQFSSIVERFKQCENLLDEHGLGYLWPSLREDGWDDIDVWKNTKLLNNKRLRSNLNWQLSDVTKFRQYIAPQGDDTPTTTEDNTDSDEKEESGSGLWSSMINSLTNGFFKYISQIIFSAITVAFGVIATFFGNSFKKVQQKFNLSSTNAAVVNDDTTDDATDKSQLQQDTADTVSG